ncbi:unnamed protein product [Protopolystoma xenopodis]|uniref:Uncharacterized protein n=1 Tax=Protopolystoma xenopodis TaxID=117903 RepID=A0A448X4F8_9PLAT|nr:unnamed protein product [Protopolystoma xenopodis]
MFSDLKSSTQTGPSCNNINELVEPMSRHSASSIDSTRIPPNLFRSLVSQLQGQCACPEALVRRLQAYVASAQASLHQALRERGVTLVNDVSFNFCQQSGSGLHSPASFTASSSPSGTASACNTAQIAACNGPSAVGWSTINSTISRVTSSVGLNVSGKAGFAGPMGININSGINTCALSTNSNSGTNTNVPNAKSNASSRVSGTVSRSRPYERAGFAVTDDISRLVPFPSIDESSGDPSSQLSMHLSSEANTETGFRRFWPVGRAGMRSMRAPYSATGPGNGQGAITTSLDTRTFGNSCDTYLLIYLVNPFFQVDLYFDFSAMNMP